MAHSKRKHRRRRKSVTTGRERVDSIHATKEAAENLRSMVMENLANYKHLRDPLSWDNDNNFSATDPEQRRNAMVSHQADKMAASLIVMPAFSEKIALQNFIDLMRCMGDKASAFKGDLHEPIIKRLTISRLICDEIYMQVMKQLSANPSMEGSQKGWELLRAMIQEILPSPEVYQFLRAFIKRQTHNPKESMRKPKVDENQKKSWRQQLLDKVRKEMLAQQMQGEDGLAGIAYQGMRGRTRAMSHSAMAEEREDDHEEQVEAARVRQATMASEIMDLLPDDE